MTILPAGAPPMEISKKTLDMFEYCLVRVLEKNLSRGINTGKYGGERSSRGESVLYKARRMNIVKRYSVNIKPIFNALSYFGVRM